MSSKMGKGEMRGRVVPAVLSALALSLTVFFFGPFELYANNMAEFAFGIWDFLGIFIAVAIVLTAAIVLALIWLPKKAFNIACAVLALIALMVYVQGTFLTLGMTSVEGDGVDGATVSTLKLVINAVIWVLVIGGGIAAVVIFFKKHTDTVRVVLTIAMVTVIGMQAVSFATLAVTTEGVWGGGADGEDNGELVEALTYKNLEKASTDANVVYFVIDRFSSSYVETAKKECPEVFEELEGFTYYDDMVSLYPRTFPSVTYMITGVENDFSRSRTDYFKYAWENSEFIDTLKDNGYSINLYTADYYAYEDSTPGGVAPFADNLSGETEIVVSDRAGLVGDMARLSLYRYLPFACRGLVGSVSSEDFQDDVQIVNKDASAYSTDMKDAYDYLKAHPLTLSEGKNFSFIHFQGTHLPNTYDRDFNEADEDERYSVADGMIQSFKIINLYIEQMKELGIYEDSTIIITGDHSSIGSDSKDPYYAHLTALFVKPCGVGEGEIKVSSAPVAQEDIHATILDSEGLENTLDYGASVLDMDGNTERERRYHFQRYIKDDGTYEVVKYRIIGEAKDFDNWTVVDRIKLDKSIYK